jgi:hypothetical protein
MAESLKARQARKARAEKAAVEAQAMKREVRFATRQSLAESQGPLVVPIAMELAQTVLLARRPNMLTLLNSGMFIEPISGMVRMLFLFGPAQVETDLGREKFEDTVLALMRATVIVPPPELLAGELEVAGITRDMCRPLFVAPGETPTEDQMVLVGAGDDETVGDDVCRFQARDVTYFAYQLLEARSGAAARFRPAGPVAANAVAPGGAVEGGGGVGETIDAAAA